MKKTIFPMIPVCHPVTTRVTPSPDPEYQPMSTESISTSAEHPRHTFAGRPEPPAAGRR